MRYRSTVAGCERSGMTTVRLWRPVGEKELALIAEPGWRRFPPRLNRQPIFYPVLSEDYATKIARDWNTKDGGTGYVTTMPSCARSRSSPSTAVIHHGASTDSAERQIWARGFLRVGSSPAKRRKPKPNSP